MGKVMEVIIIVSLFVRALIMLVPTKSSSYLYSKTGTLQSIQYPTGGTEIFTYEENEYLGFYQFEHYW